MNYLLIFDGEQRYQIYLYVYESYEFYKNNSFISRLTVEIFSAIFFFSKMTIFYIIYSTRVTSKLSSPSVISSEPIVFYSFFFLFV